MEINCNECKQDFDMKVKVKKHKGSIEEVYFICPHCKERYTSYYTDRLIRVEQSKIRKKYEKLEMIVEPGTRRILVDDIRNHKEELKIKMDNLKHKMIDTQ